LSGVVALLIVSSVVVTLFIPGPSVSLARKQSGEALSGEITSPEEGAMEGVVVSARKDNSTITVSVISDKQGNFRFSAARLDPGHYSLAIRAVGYELERPEAADVGLDKTATVDIKLRKASDLASQLTSAEWLLSIPGTDEQKISLMGCVNCHTLKRPLTSTYTGEELTKVIQRMYGYASGSEPSNPQRRVNADAQAGSRERYRKLADYIASINLSKAPEWRYSLKTLPRPTGRSTQVIITTYDLPRATAMPHDVIVDKRGNAWYTDFGAQYLGKLDPQTGKVSEWEVPKPKADHPEGMLDIEEDHEGAIWLGMMFQAAIARFDPKTERFKVYGAPDVLNDNGTPKSQERQRELTLQYSVDGRIWTTEDNGEIERVDLRTGKYERFQPLKNFAEPPPYSIYGIAADSKNNLYFAENVHSLIGRIDAKTGEVKLYPTPSRHSYPRRVQMDAQDRLWIGEYTGNRIGLFDTKTEKFTEWQSPTPWSGPYYVTRDKNGELWTGGMTSDRVTRLDPKTGEFAEYLLPGDTNMRRVFVDDSTTPVTFWAGSTHGAAIVKVEPLNSKM
jgi:virginiamycin B lyase